MVPKDDTTTHLSLRKSRLQGMLTGSFIGDALAMPVHWYYDQEALAEDYGEVRDYLAPKNPHPGSILWRSEYEPLNEKGEILHDQAQYWGCRGVHYHQFLKAGENTLNLKLNRLLWKSLEDHDGFDPQAFLEAYIAFMRDPDSHRDTYLEEYHRNFFHNYARGKRPELCAEEEKHIGGLVGMLPILAWYGPDTEEGRTLALRRLAQTHPGKKMENAANFVIDILAMVVDNQDLAYSIEQMIATQRYSFLGYPWREILDRPTRKVLKDVFSTVCYVDQSVPAVAYLAHKYAEDPETALIENTMAGGDNCYRGAVLGALLGAAHGESGFPRQWVQGLAEPLIEIHQ